VTAVELLARLHDLDVKVWADGDRLRVSAPNGVMTPDLRQQLTARKTELLALLQAEGGARLRQDPGSEIGALAPTPRTGPIPLSFSQQRLWFIDRLQPGSAAYSIAGAVRLRGRLDLEALEWSFTQIVRRHEVLRTSFPAVDGEPRQVVAAPEPVKIPVTDLADVPTEEREAEARRRAQAIAQRPFRLAEGPLLRGELLQLAEGDYVLVVVMHHIVSDGWSLQVLQRELRTLYRAAVAREPSPLPPLAIQYADFARWQRQWLTGEALERRLQYWVRQLRGSPPVLELPTDHARRAIQRFRGGRHLSTLSGQLADGIRALCRREGVTLFMGLLTAFKALLHRYTGQSDILVGVPVANRGRMEIEPLIGFFVNTVVLRTDFSEDPTFREALQRTRRVALDAYAHDDLPFERLVEALGPARDLSHTPLFQVMFTLNRPEGTDAELPDLSLSAFDIHAGTTPTDLTLMVTEHAEALRLRWIFDADLFEPATIERMAQHLEELLQAAVAEPERRVSRLPLLTPGERWRLLIDWNATASDYPRDRCIHELFEEQARRTPEAVALVSQNGAVTYRELGARADTLAHRLRTHGVMADVPVAVWMDRSVDLVVALLGILKAGGAYLPLDLATPPERVAFMLGDAGAALLLTDRERRDRLPRRALRALCLDEPWSDAPEAPKCARRPTAESLAYVMYTSGSTGLPKGVCVPHRAVVRLVRSTNYVRLTADETFLQLAPVSFDASTFEIWGALLNGARLVLYPGQIPVLAELREIIARHRVSTLWLTAGLFHHVVEHDLRSLEPVRQLLAGGDVLSIPHVERVLAELPDCRLINGYGPTENTTFSCCHPITDRERIIRSVPIGRPIANTRAYVLDAQLQPVPTGVVGELCVAGDGLARGYLNRPELTSERFVAAPFPEEPGRLYRTGDRARYLPDGSIEFLGRSDHQVKIRGYRVELGEIEVALGRHPAVRQVVVVAVTAASADRRLVAYLVMDGPRPPAVAELRAFLEASLPGYMIPTAWVVLDALPITENGKIDRSALPAPEPRSDQARPDSRVPADDIERRLVEIWAATLGVARVDPRDSFFELGGHSLLAVELFARIEKAFGVSLPLATLFQASSLEEQARIIRQGGWTAPRRSLVAIQPHGSRPPFFAVPGVGGSVLGFNILARLTGADRPFYGLQSVGLDGEAPPLSRVEDIAAHFVSEIRTVQPQGPYHLLGTCMGGVVAYEMAQQLNAAGESVALLALLETWPPQSVRSVPMFRLGRGVFLRLVVGRMLLYARTFARLERAERMEYLKTRLNVVKRTLASRDPFRGDRSELDRMRVSQANMHALSQYAPRPYPGSVVLFRAKGRRLVSRADRRLAWGKLALAGMQLYDIPGEDSGLMLSEPNVSILAGRLEAHLRASLVRAAGSP
jgi:aspartate racemase